MNNIITFIKRQSQVTFWGIAYLTISLGFLMDALYPSDLWSFVVWGPFLGGARPGRVRRTLRGMEPFLLGLEGMAGRVPTPIR